MMHGAISREFLASATWLDSFFGNERYEAEISRSQLRLRFDAFREGTGGMDYRRPNFDLRLVLPQLRKKMRLVIAGEQNPETDTTTAQTTAAANQQVPPANGHVSTSVQYVPVETKRSNFSIRSGLKLHTGRIVVFAGPRYRYLLPLDSWDFRFTQEAQWGSDTRWQVRSRFDLERSLPGDLFFRTSLEGFWAEGVNGYAYSQSFLLSQPLDQNRAVQFEWINTFQTRPAQELDQVLLLFRYRQRFWRDWLFLELDPQYRFLRSLGFTATPGILFRIEMVFGGSASVF